MGLAKWLVKKTATGKQQWTGYPESPVLTATYEYQAITFGYYGAGYKLTCANAPMSVAAWGASLALYATTTTLASEYSWDGSAWVLSASGTYYSGNPITTFSESAQSNYTHTGITKTTTAEQDAAIVTSLVRIN